MNNYSYNNFFNDFTHQNFKGLSDFLTTLDPYEFAAVGVIAALLISPTLSTNQQNSVGNFLEEIGQIILTIAAQEQTVQNINQNSQGEFNNNQNISIYNLQQEIENLKSIINDKYN